MFNLSEQYAKFLSRGLTPTSLKIEFVMRKKVSVSSILLNLLRKTMHFQLVGWMMKFANGSHIKKDCFIALNKGY